MGNTEKVGGFLQGLNVRYANLVQPCLCKQVGGSGELHQRCLTLTAQLIAAQSKEAVMDKRAEELLVGNCPWGCVSL
jgi:hypothetical protein